MRQRKLHAPISASPLVRDLDGDGRLEVVLGAASMGFWKVGGDGRLRSMPGWPRYGEGAFASSPAAGDIDGDGRPEIVAGSDDDGLYAWRLDGSLLPGFPFRTGGDVYSSPALVDLNGDGRPEIVFGSDDGCVYAIDGRGRPLPGWPVRTGGFVSASPAAGDLDGDGRPEIVIGSWDRKLRVIDAGGAIWSAANGHPGWPVELGTILWSTAAISPPDGDGRVRIAVAAERLHVLDPDGRAAPGWPRWIGGFTVSSPVWVDLDGGRGPSLVIGGDGLSVFHADGRPRDGFPLDLGGHVWATPRAFDCDGDGVPEIYAGSVGGAFHALKADGTELPGFPIRCAGPVFASAGVARSPSGAPALAFGSWGGDLRLVTDFASGVRADQRSQAPRSMTPRGEPAGHPCPPLDHLRARTDPDPPQPHRATFLYLDGIAAASVRSVLLHYTRPDGSEHPSPFLAHDGGLFALIEPLQAGTVVPWHVTLEGWDGGPARWPSAGRHLLRVAGGSLGGIRERLAGALRRVFRSA
jgi:hypothetical protein